MAKAKKPIKTVVKAGKGFAAKGSKMPKDAAKAKGKVAKKATKRG